MQDGRAPAPQPPYFDAAAGVHVFTRHADVLAVLSAPQGQVPSVDQDMVRRLEHRLPGKFAPLVRLNEGLLVFLDGPRHEVGRERAKLILRHFMQQGGQATKLEALAKTVLLAERSGEVIDGVKVVTRFIDQQWARFLALNEDTTWQIVTEMEQFLQDWPRMAPLAVFEARNHSATGMMQAVLAGLPDGVCPWAPDGIVDSDAPVLLFMLSVANGTVKQMMGSVLHLLAHDSAEQDRLRQDPERWSGFLEEALRLLGSVRYRERIVGPEGLPEFGLGPGARVRLRLDSAGRDEAAYPDPERLVPERHHASPRPAPILAFGAGAHLCAGRILARAQIRALIAPLLRQARLHPGAEPASPIRDPSIRGFDMLPLRLEPI